MANGRTIQGVLHAAAIAVAILACEGARAQDAPAKLRDLCTDRPTKSTAPCTVDPGHVQVETDLFNNVFDRTGGVDTDTYLFTNPTLKYGVTRTFDIEVNLAPLVEITTRNRATGAKTDATGVGDLYLRAKLNLAGDDGGTIGLALEPYVKVPTARMAIGNGAVEAGLIAPISITLPAKFSLSLAPEIDVLEDAVGDGHHANFVNLVGVSRALGPVTLAGEFWTDVNRDPTHPVTQYSADLGLSWIPAKQPNLQLDGGLNFGLNRETPSLQAYVGISRRF